MVWAAFILSATVIVYAGTKLSVYGDHLAERTGLGGLWIGVVLMAAATSLPEVITTISAALMDAPDLAVGDLLGAGLTNMLTLGVIDLVHRQKRVWQQAAFEQILIAGLAMGLTGLAGLIILIRTTQTVWQVGLETVFIAAIYVFGMRLVYRQEDVRRQERLRRKLVEAEAEAPDRRPSLQRSMAGFGLAAMAIVVSAPVLAASANAIAELTGISTTFIGTSLLAVATSLPELVTALAAVRLGAYDLAVGNLFGSNAFNMAALLFVDLAYRPGPVLSALAPAHAATALVSIILMNIAVVGIIYRAEKRYLLIEPDSLLMITGYGLGMWLLFRYAA